MLSLDKFPQSAMLGGHIVKVAFDPTGKLGVSNKEKLLAAAGMLPSIFSEAAGEPDTETAESLYKAAVKVYGFGDYSSVEWGTVDPDGTYKPSQGDDEWVDPDLYPMVDMRWPFGVEVLVYQHAIIAVRDEDETIISRMD